MKFPRKKSNCTCNSNGSHFLSYPVFYVFCTMCRLTCLVVFLGSRSLVSKFLSNWDMLCFGYIPSFLVRLLVIWSKSGVDIPWRVIWNWQASIEVGLSMTLFSRGAIWSVLVRKGDKAFLTIPVETTERLRNAESWTFKEFPVSGAGWS